MNNQKRSKHIWQTWKNIFAFYFVFTRNEWVLRKLSVACFIMYLFRRFSTRSFHWNQSVLSLRPFSPKRLTTLAALWDVHIAGDLGRERDGERNLEQQATIYHGPDPLSPIVPVPVLCSMNKPLELLLTLVDSPDVYFQITVLIKHLVTHVADIGFFVCMFHHVSLQTSLLWECLSTLVALEWFLACVGFEMLVQIIVSTKCFVTDVANVWFFAGVCHHVHS